VSAAQATVGGIVSQPEEEGLHLVVDSTGVKLYSE
jgi:hypothetical protein